MFGAENVRLVLSFDGIYLFFGAVLLAAASYFYYKRTLPPISETLRAFLIGLRFLALFSVLLMFFAPKIEYVKTYVRKPRVAFFFDNSKSVTVDDSVKTASEIKSFAERISESDKFQASLFLFGDSVRKISAGVTDKIDFTENKTNLENVFEKIIDEEDSLDAAVLISDGAVTAGENPTALLREVTIPVNVIVSGTAKKFPDLSIKRFAANSITYAGVSAPAEVSVYAEGEFAATKKRLTFFVNGKKYLTKTIDVAPVKVVKIAFDYKIEKPGKYRLTVSVPALKGEKDLLNNKTSISVEVLERKKKILLVSGSPDYDVTFIRQAILSDTNFVVKNILFFSDKKTIPRSEILRELSEAKAIFFVGYPAEKYDPAILRLFENALKKGKSYYFEFTPATDLKAAAKLTSSFEFSGGRKPRFIQAQNFAENKSLPFFNGISEKALSDGDFPPVNLAVNPVKFPPYFSVMLSAEINNSALNKSSFLYADLQNSKVVFSLASDLWKWKLQGGSARDFDTFFSNIAKWLTNTSKKKRLELFSRKKNYAQTESAQITAQLYNEFLEPVNNAELTGVLTGKGIKRDVNFTAGENGIYFAEVKNLPPGDFKVTAHTKINGKKETASVNFTVSPVNIETATAKRNLALLTQIAERTGGNLAELSKGDSLINLIDKSLSAEKIRKKYNFIFFPRQDFLIFIILLFTFEWIIRKRKGLL